MEPEQPAIRREKNMYTPHAVPMKRPPMKASRGRKEFIVLRQMGIGNSVGVREPASVGMSDVLVFSREHKFGRYDDLYSASPRAGLQGPSSEPPLF